MPKVVLPAASPNQTYVTISALDAGHLTLPEHLFISDADKTVRATVPSLSFLIRHPCSTTTTSSSTSPLDNPARGLTNLVFDLGLKRDLTQYAPAQQAHIANRQPTVLAPDCGDSLRAGGLDPAADVDVVLLSHAHWDHVGTAADFAAAAFVVGPGTLHLLAHGAPPHYPRDIFAGDEVPAGRTRELPPVPGRGADDAARAAPPDRRTAHAWRPLGDGAVFPAVVDLFGDGSVFVVDSPGHLYGHVNLLARTGPRKWVFLGGDCCHDPRILTGEKGIALYDDGHGGLRSVHVDTEAARDTVGRIRSLLGSADVVEEGAGVVEMEVIVAHDKVWREKNRDRFWPGKL
ncbi:hypothetical protein BDY21DRAFT_293522 [Lineolata rhizophorae]|uniref:Metallo-beta-lactamase domain-containing protein n=1 Tax=Lineolata rhizophorae TaxID=578093 RepID=A0A6A6NNB6_9PEZI|nr:hypothetical protein BDY21DRAFT_293522 [Lineolata rhizophorae]